mmetsp:Transcript_23233/g.65230  ORF Transcript_23233/g.65230 Transcript_23233/m.65230 type:complete len:235 (+) Transcript_23233:48-752(+)
MNAVHSIQIVYDFDYTIIDANSDTWFLQELAPDLHETVAEDHKRFSGWTEYVDDALDRLHTDRGLGSNEVLASLEQISIEPEMKQSILHAKAAGHELRILSDANTVFIHTILARNGMQDVFSTITTNPARIEDGRVRVTRFDTSADHGCSLCPANLCKGGVVGTWAGYDRTYYVGDGWGDLCPILKLTSSDVAFVRRGKTLARYLNQKAEHTTKATVVYWNDARELQSKLLKFI